MAKHVKNIAGKKFGKLTAIRRCQDIGKTAYWVYRCKCGKEKIINKSSVTVGIVRCCGCQRKKRNKSIYHGFSNKPWYSEWVRKYKNIPIHEFAKNMERQEKKQNYRFEDVPAHERPEDFIN